MAKSVPKKGTKKVCLYIEQELLDKIKTITAKEERSSSYVTNKILRSYFENREWQ
jgi:uncharacterized protein YqfB (UPF0267 family)